MAQWQRLELDKLREEHLLIFQCTYVTDKPVLFDKIPMGVKHASQAACDSVFMLKGIKSCRSSRMRFRTRLVRGRINNDHQMLLSNRIPVEKRELKWGRHVRRQWEKRAGGGWQRRMQGEMEGHPCRKELKEKKKKTPANAYWRLPSVPRWVWFLGLDSPAEAMAFKW